MSEPFRDNEHSVREQGARLAREIHDLDHQIRVARSGLENYEEVISPLRAKLFNAMTLFLVLCGLIFGALIADKVVEAHVVGGRVSCGPF